jgi:hypothetical protein
MRKQNRNKVGGLKPKSAAVANIKPLKSARGVGPDHGGPGFARSLPTHIRVRSGPPSTFAT